MPALHSDTEQCGTSSLGLYARDFCGTVFGGVIQLLGVGERQQT